MSAFRSMSRWSVPVVAAPIMFASIAVALLHGDALMMQIEFDRQFLAPSLAHPFGTDRFGRDVLLFALAGLGYSVMFAGAALGCAAVIGTVWGDAVAAMERAGTRRRSGRVE